MTREYPHSLLGSGYGRPAVRQALQRPLVAAPEDHFMAGRPR